MDEHNDIYVVVDVTCSILRKWLLESGKEGSEYYMAGAQHSYM